MARTQARILCGVNAADEASMYRRRKREHLAVESQKAPSREITHTHSPSTRKHNIHTVGYSGMNNRERKKQNTGDMEACGCPFLLLSCSTPSDMSLQGPSSFTPPFPLLKMCTRCCSIFLLSMLAVSMILMSVCVMCFVGPARFLAFSLLYINPRALV